jgi:transposase
MRNVTKKKYGRDFKKQTVELADSSGKADRTIEKELGLYQGAIHGWREELRIDSDGAFPGKGHVRSSNLDVHKLLKENEILRKERDILKKAMAIFSQPKKHGTGS